MMGYRQGGRPVVEFFGAEQIAARVHQSMALETFTPFLGAGASRLVSDDLTCSPWIGAIAQVNHLISLLADQAERQYIISVAQAHGLDVDTNDWDVGACDLDHELLPLQVSLIRLGAVLTGLFGGEMVEQRPCVGELHDFGVVLPDGSGSDQIAALSPLVTDAMDAARVLRDGGFASDLSTKLRPNDIYERLTMLGCRLCSRSEDKPCTDFPDRCKPHKDLILDLRTVVDLTKRTTIYLDELGWLGDLVWHTLRYRFPVYPTTSDLTFFLSLLLGDNVPELRRSPLAQVAEVHELVADYDEVELVRDWFMFCEDEHPTTAFHIPIAAALQHVYEKSSPGGDMVPIGFTTNYDRALEKALEALGITYHVAFPVHGTMSDSAEAKEDVLWLFKTVPAPGSREVAASVQDASSWGNRALEAEGLCEELAGNVAGPVVVKLHGSPLEPLPARIRPYHSLRHCLILSESSYLDSVVARKYPQWIEDELKRAGRVLWFLGYSMTDWNVRLRLYQHVRDTSEVVSPGLPSKAVLAQRLDLVRSAVLGTLQVTVYEADLRKFAGILRRVPGVDEVLRRQDYRQADLTSGV